MDKVELKDLRKEAEAYLRDYPDDHRVKRQIRLLDHIDALEGQVDNPWFNAKECPAPSGNQYVLVVRKKRKGNSQNIVLASHKNGKWFGLYAGSNTTLDVTYWCYLPKIPAAAIASAVEAKS